MRVSGSRDAILNLFCHFLTAIYKAVSKAVSKEQVISCGDFHVVPPNLIIRVRVRVRIKLRVKLREGSEEPAF